MIRERNRLSLAEVQAISLIGLKTLTQNLEREGINYYLSYGTLIGAIRHQGFIPWDDDIDLLVPRKDYVKMIGISDRIDDTDWELMSYEGTNGYALPWAKYCNKSTIVYPSRFCSGLLYGCSIDIFPLDFIDADTYDDAISICDDISSKYQTMYRHYKPTGILRTGIVSSVKRPLKAVRHNIINMLEGNWTTRLTELDQYISSKTKNEAQYAAYVLDTTSHPWPISWFDNGNGPSIVMFSGLELRAPYDYDSLLREYYGDYMTPPQVDDRVGHCYKGIYRK